MKALLLSIALCSASCFAQAVQPQPEQPQPEQPTLDLANQTAIRSTIQAQQAAQQAYSQARMLESQVIQQWEAAHPGWTVNPGNMQVVVKSAPKVTAEKPVPKVSTEKPTPQVAPVSGQPNKSGPSVTPPKK